ncbi:MAG: hypothetical protein HOI80_03205 [Alphaproteobacteria bacterium]|nr:hypothetical protein [Alphaproteobacteria bacterium]MBT5654492.1 hypothetical protein [Alphaproteobacteria bacterium]
MAFPLDFEKILHPIGIEEFFEVYYDKKPLHIPFQSKNKDEYEVLTSLMTWEKLNQILNMTSVWSSTSLQLHLENKPINPSLYCYPAIDRNQQQILQPNSTQIVTFLEQGASLVCNDIDSLLPDLSHIANLLERTFSSKIQANLYCSWKEKQAFHSHFDTHEVFVFHTVGEKRWLVYDGREVNPISHPTFLKMRNEARAEQKKGDVLLDITLKPGDFLYIPRGQYHDALATSEGTVHISFGGSPLIGLDLLSYLFEKGLSSEFLRNYIPPHKQDNKKYLNKFVKEVLSIVEDPCFETELDRLSKSRGYPRSHFTLPSFKTNPHFHLTSENFSIIESENENLLKGPKGTTVPIPTEFTSVIPWMLKNAPFDFQTFSDNFLQLNHIKQEGVLNDLINMGVLRKAK